MMTNTPMMTNMIDNMNNRLITTNMITDNNLLMKTNWPMITNDENTELKSGVNKWWKMMIDNAQRLWTMTFQEWVKAFRLQKNSSKDNFISFNKY